MREYRGRKVEGLRCAHCQQKSTVSTGLVAGPSYPIRACSTCGLQLDDEGF